MRLRNLHRNSHRLWEAIPIAASDKLGTEEEQEETKKKKKDGHENTRKGNGFRHRIVVIYQYYTRN